MNVIFGAKGFRIGTRKRKKHCRYTAAMKHLFCEGWNRKRRRRKHRRYGASASFCRMKKVIPSQARCCGSITRKAKRLPSGSAVMTRSGSVNMSNRAKHI